MEKKGSRSVKPSSKGLTTDTKKNQDVKVWPRGGRRREPNGGTFPKTETSRKPIPQRNKTVDKRPRSRGYYSSGAACGKENTGLEVEEAELGSVFIQGSKKQSLNHLLNFHFEPREGNWHSSGVHSKSGHRLNSTLKHKYNKEQFLQANCQFIVQESGDYTAYMNNPDSLVNWSLIEQVNIHVLEFPSCPICLYPPVAAKMTRCGHIYCWSCLLHYLALSDKEPRTCPICYEDVRKKDLKSVVTVPHDTFNINKNITFKLMKRQRGSLIAYPVEQQVQDVDTPFNVSNKITNDIYSKLLLAGKTEVLSIIGRERRQLLNQLEETQGCPEKCFVEQALVQLNEREIALNSSNGISKPIADNQNNQLHQDQEVADENAIIEENLQIKVLDWYNGEPEYCNLIDAVNKCVSLNKATKLASSSNERERYESVSSENLGSEEFNGSCDIPAVAEDLNISSSRHVESQSSKYFYFYQASDGQHIYLHALNARMLEHAYGSLEFCPKTITGRIIDKESESVTEDLRKRLRYLQHLPVTCQFEVAEIQMKPPLVTEKTLEYFRDQIEMRRRRRQRRARDEKRREKRIAEEENRKMGKYAAANIKLESHHQFPDFHSENGKPNPALGEDITHGSPHSERSLSPSSAISSQTGGASVSGSLNTENDHPGVSFAKMLSSNKTPSVWPVRKSLTASKSKVVTPAANPTTSKVNDDDAAVDGYVPVPAFNQSFGDAIALALEKAALSNDTNEPKVSGKKKKKSKQKTLLFATNMYYSGN